MSSKRWGRKWASNLARAAVDCAAALRDRTGFPPKCARCVCARSKLHSQLDRQSFAGYKQNTQRAGIDVLIERKRSLSRLLKRILHSLLPLSYLFQRGSRFPCRVLRAVTVNSVVLVFQPP